MSRDKQTVITDTENKSNNFEDMSNKQIEEMVAIIHHSDKNYNNIFPTSLNECLYKHGGVRTNAGIALCNAGYRKASDVAEEIFAEIEKETEIGRIMNACAIVSLDAIAELKKKYTENKGE